MNQAADSVTVALTGGLFFVLLLAALLAWVVSRAILARYRRAVRKHMQAAGMQEHAPAPAEPSDPHLPPLQATLDFAAAGRAPSPSGAAAALFSELRRAPWRAAAVYALGGGCYAAVMALAYSISAGGVHPVRFLLLWWVYAWPVVLTVNLVAAATRRTKLLTLAAYFTGLAVVGAVAHVRNPSLGWGSLPLLWLITNLPPTVLLQAFLSRKVRAVGPLVLSFMIVALVGSNLVIAFVNNSQTGLETAVDLGFAVGLGAWGIFFALILIGAAALVPVGWLALRRIRTLYERKQVSDQSITLDALWLLFAVLQSIGLVFEGIAWGATGLVAFGLYKVVVRIGFAQLGAGMPAGENRPKLLLLRVFSLGERSERLFDVLGTRWRYVGSVQLIAGPDLATSAIEPHEFLDFMSGKLPGRFIDGPPALDRALVQMDTMPDRDGRFRVNEFFCRDHTWKAVLSRLVSESTAVLMDLRGFSEANAGCRFEIDELINTVPLEKVVFLVDETTHEAFLRSTVQASWSGIKTTSPNRLSSSARFPLFRFEASRTGEVKRLLQTLCAAAGAPSSVPARSPQQARSPQHSTRGALR